MSECPRCDRTGIPRHVVGLFNAPPGTPPPVPVHIDCCADQGCAHCTHLIAAAGGRRGHELADHYAAQRAARTERELTDG